MFRSSKMFANIGDLTSNVISSEKTYLYVLKFIYSEKATKFCEISTVDLSYVVTVKSTVEVSQKFVAFSEYMNFNLIFLLPYILSSLFAFFSFLSCLRKHEKIQQNRCFLSGRVKGELYS